MLITPDGRRAVRQLAEPFELAPTVEAMLIGFDSAPTAPSQGVVLDEESTGTSLMDRPAGAPSLPPPKPAANVLLGGSFGTRVGGQLATPVVAAFGALHSGFWELGVTGQWEASYGSIGAEAARAWSAAGFAAGVAVGRRQPLSSVLDLRLGISLAGAVLHQETHHQRPEQWLTRADARLGAYAGAVLPRRGLVRFRTELGVDFVPNTGQTQAATPDIPSLPSWAASLSIGAETNGP